MNGQITKGFKGWINWRGSVFFDVTLRQTRGGVLVLTGLPSGKLRLKDCELQQQQNGYAIRGVRAVPGGVRLVEEITFFFTKAGGASFAAPPRQGAV
jgi:hypothetical protein